MILRVLGSGSKGNSVLLEAGDTRVLVDAGFSPRGIKARLEVFDVHPESIQAVIVTHEHGDHVRGVARCSRRWGWRVLATDGTRTGSRSLGKISVESIATSGQFAIGGMEIQTVGTSHDANEPLAVVATGKDDGARVGIVYDLGVFTERLYKVLQDLDILMLESNHDVEMLRNGPYPRVLQRRIASRYGHLSNRDSAIAARQCVHKHMSHLILAHLSQKNNTARIATETMTASLKRTSFTGTITAASQGKTTGPFVPRGTKYRGARQLELGLEVRSSRDPTRNE